MDPGQLQKLLESQQKGLRSCETKLERLAQYEHDYDSLCSRLRTLPDSVSHEVMVPLNSLAFMPGRLVHTNEILVLLGDNWFAERSARQALAIAERRADQCRRMQQGLLGEKEQRTNWMRYTDQLHRESGYADIREPYDPVEEQAWRERHRKNVRDHRKTRKQENSEATEPAADVWKMLDRLELQEKEGREASHEETSRKVRWQDESSGHISFSYSDTSGDWQETLSSNSDTIMSPGDIFRMFGGTETGAAKSILKSSAGETKITSADKKSPVPFMEPHERPKLSLGDAFTGAIFERGIQGGSETTLDIDVTEIEIPAALRRPRSLFKAKREAT